MGTATETTIEQQVAEVTGLSQKENEPRNKWLARLVKSADTKLDDEEWAELSSEAQNWVNASMKALNNSEPIVDPAASPVKSKTKAAAAQAATAEEQDLDEEDDDASDDDDGDSDGDSNEGDDGSVEPTSVEKPTRKGKAAKQPKERKARAGHVAPSRTATTRNSKSDKGAADAWRKIVVKHPTASREAHEAQLAKLNLKLHPGRMYFIRSEALKVLALLE